MSKELPAVVVHARITGINCELEDVESLRDAIVAVVDKFSGGAWGCRVRRRVVGPREGLRLLKLFETRAAAGLVEVRGPRQRKRGRQTVIETDTSHRR